MSDEEQSEGGDVAVATTQDSVNTVLKTLMSEIEKLKNENKQTKQALAAVMNKSQGEDNTSSKNDPSGAQQTQVENAPSSVVQYPQVVYVSRERKMKKFSGSRGVDGKTVEDFVNNVKSLISVREMTQIEQADFVLSLLESAAKEEVKEHIQKLLDSSIISATDAKLSSRSNLPIVVSLP